MNAQVREPFFSWRTRVLMDVMVKIRGIGE